MTSPLPSQLTRLADQISTIIVGKRPQIEDCVACLLAGGHLLIEDIPGVGKTTLAHALAVSLGLRFSRMQFTADLMPSDLLGVSVYERSKGSRARTLCSVIIKKSLKKQSTVFLGQTFRSVSLKQTRFEKFSL